MEDTSKNDAAGALEFWKSFNLDDKRLVFDKQVILSSGHISRLSLARI